MDTNGRKLRQTKEQLSALLSTSFRMLEVNENDQYIHEALKTFTLIEDSTLFWNKNNEDSLMESTITLSNTFFKLCKKAFPIDKRAMIYLKKSPLCLDIYFWLAIRFFSIKKPTLIAWPKLMEQFGSNYADDKFGRMNFKNEFKKALAEIKILYPNINSDFTGEGLVLRPSKLFIKRSK